MVDYNRKILETPTFTELVELPDELWALLLDTERQVLLRELIKEQKNEASKQ